MALVEPCPDSKRLVRYAWRFAQPQGSALDLLWVKRSGTSLSQAQGSALADLTRLASLLGATFLIEDADNVAATIATIATIARVAAERGTAVILMGPARELGGIDVGT
jgi:K+-sensing histidine kinase KdpD